jgi:hypothetical protein
MKRITERDLEGLVGRINRMTKSPLTPYLKHADGKFTAWIGNYHISHAYGGVCLHRMVNEGGGVRDVLMCGHVPRRELYTAMHAYILGLEESQT